MGEKGNWTEKGCGWRCWRDGQERQVYRPTPSLPYITRLRAGQWWPNNPYLADPNTAKHPHEQGNSLPQFIILFVFRHQHHINGNLSLVPGCSRPCCELCLTASDAMPLLAAHNRVCTSISSRRWTLRRVPIGQKGESDAHFGQQVTRCPVSRTVRSSGNGAYCCLFGCVCLWTHELPIWVDHMGQRADAGNGTSDSRAKRPVKPSLVTERRGERP